MAIILYARKSIEREGSISCETQIEYCKSMIKPDERNEKAISIIDNGFSGGNVSCVEITHICSPVPLCFIISPSIVVQKEPQVK